MISLCIMGNLGCLALECHCFGAYVIYTPIFEQDLILVQQLFLMHNYGRLTLCLYKDSVQFDLEGKKTVLFEWFIQL